MLFHGLEKLCYAYIYPQGYVYNHPSHSSWIIKTSISKPSNSKSQTFEDRQPPPPPAPLFIYILSGELGYDDNIKIELICSTLRELGVEGSLGAGLKAELADGDGRWEMGDGRRGGGGFSYLAQSMENQRLLFKYIYDPWR